MAESLFRPDDYPPAPTRFCLHGGPGAGKSSLAASLYADLKAKQRKVEMVRERIKEFAYLGRKPTHAEKVRFFAGELAEELAWCELGLDVVTDSPLWLAAYYADRGGHPFAQHFAAQAKHMDETYPAVHLFLPRKFAYDPAGRYQTAEEAAKVDDDIKDYLTEHKVPFRALK